MELLEMTEGLKEVCRAMEQVTPKARNRIAQALFCLYPVTPMDMHTPRTVMIVSNQADRK